MTPAPKGNTNAQRSTDGPLDGRLDLRVSKAEKALWIEAAKAEGMKLAPWVAKTLNAAAG